MMSGMIAGSTARESISQFPIAPGSALDGREIRELRDMGVNVRVMLVRQDATTHLSPLGSFRIEGGAVLVAVGDGEELEKMEKLASV